MANQYGLDAAQLNNQVAADMWGGGMGLAGAGLDWYNALRSRGG
jgi:hypothetical protein